MNAYSAQLIQGAIGFLVALILCRGVIALKINDRPDGDRKLQNAPVPSAGGIAIAGASMLGWVAGLEYLDVQSLSVETYVVVVVAMAALFVGLVDDMGFIGTKLKLAVLLGLSIAAASQLYVYQPYWFYDAGLFSPAGDGADGTPDIQLPIKILLISGSALWLFVIMNAVNFMDGSNGLMAGCAAIMFLGLTLLTMALTGQLGAAQMPFVSVMAAICGFLIWNFQDRLYSGDTGSLMLGGLFAAFSLIIVRTGNVSVFTVATFALPFLVDVILTVIWRARRGRNILKAHREHAYQLFLRAGWPHWKVALLWWGGTLVCVVVGLVAFMMRGSFPAIAFGISVAFGLGAWRAQRKYFEGRLGL